MTLRYKRPDAKNALSIVQSAYRDMVFTLSLKLSKDAGTTIIRNIYECFRMLGDALLVYRGIKSTDHIMPIKELLQLKVSTTRPIYSIENLCRLRHNINYYGYAPDLLEIKDAISLAKSCFDPLRRVVLDKIAK
jgi:hypothetical protein